MNVSIITATFNSSAHIVDCLASVYEQTYPNIEHIIIDGASKDNTLEIIKSMPNRVSKIVTEPDGGIYDAINKGITFATGEVIGLVHSNDLLSNPYVIENISKIFERTGCDILYANTECFLRSNRDKIVRIDRGGHFHRARFKQGWMPSHPTVYCKKEVFQKVGLYRLDLKIAADYEFLLRAMYKNKFKIHFFDSVIYRYELGGTSSKNLRNILLSNLECRKAWVLNDMPVPKFLIFNKLVNKIPQFVKAIGYGKNSKNN